VAVHLGSTSSGIGRQKGKIDQMGDPALRHALAVGDRASAAARISSSIRAWRSGV